MSSRLSLLLSNFEQYKDGDNYIITRSEFTNIIDNNKNIKPMCSFFVWLNENRKDIEKTYFGDFYSIEDWSIDYKKQYYNSKGLDYSKVKKKKKVVQE